MSEEPTALADTAVALRRLTKRFGDRLLLDDINLTIGRGEFFVLVGHSGSGKSTLLKIISGIDTAHEGQVWLGGQDASRLPAYRRPVHTVFQHYALFPHLNVADNVGFPLRVHRVPRTEQVVRVQRALAWVKLEPLAQRRIESLSGGEKQRVAVARALVDEPECVLLDEPLSALDPHLRGQTLELLQEIQANLRLTYVYVTHDRDEALRAAHRIGILHQGRLEQVGTPEEVYRLPATAFVASFLGPISWLEGELTTHDGRTVVVFPRGHSWPVEGRKLPASRKVIFGLRPEDVRLGADGLFTAQILRAQFSGAVMLVQVKSESGALMTAQLAADRAVPKIGETVKVSWPPAAGHLFAALLEREFAAV